MLSGVVELRERQLLPPDRIPVLTSYLQTIDQQISSTYLRFNALSPFKREKMMSQVQGNRRWRRGGRLLLMSRASIHGVMRRQALTGMSRAIVKPKIIFTCCIESQKRRLGKRDMCIGVSLAIAAI